MHRLIAAGVLCAGLLAADDALAQKILGAGALFGGPPQARAVCYLDHLTDNPNLSLTIESFQICDKNGSVLSLVINQCGSSLGDYQA